ncbi:MAG: hypothetical protein SVG88_02910 [Halobacteriales archaeon]|nr:hypothetical protein [Halobacteriales archaeon]
MGLLEWGIVVLAVYPLLQLPAMWYLSYRTEMDEETRQEPRRGYDNFREIPAEEAAATESTAQSASLPDGIVACTACGAHNNTTYAYCRDCTARLG